MRVVAHYYSKSVPLKKSDTGCSLFGIVIETKERKGRLFGIEIVFTNWLFTVHPSNASEALSAL